MSGSRFRRPPASFLVFAFGWLVCASFGCRQPKNEDFVPQVDVAEQALVQVLEAWKAGKPAGEIPGTKPLVYGADTSRKPDQVLTSYRVLGETPGSAGRTYAVELHLERPEEHLKLQYIVVGIDPLWVFREEDYQLLMHWDHVMPAPSPAVSSETPAPQVPGSTSQPPGAAP